MASAILDGISTRYEVIGDGPSILMYAPGGFDATIEKWSTLGIYARIKLLEHLPKKYRCIVFDRRECGESGGRVEAITWAHYAKQGRSLLEHLKIERAHVMGGCMGCSCVMAFAVAYPEATRSMLLWWPVGGAKYRIRAQERFKAFKADRNGGGPWASVIRRDPQFAAAFAKTKNYEEIVEQMCRNLFDRDTSPGAEPEQLMKLDIPALIVPGRDESHATSAARYLEECLPKAQYWDVLPEAQNAERVLQFLLDVDREAAR